MSENSKDTINYRCPYCLLHNADPYLIYDKEKEEYFCQFCAFVGDENKIQHFYGVLTEQYIQMNERINIVSIAKVGH